MPYTATIPDLDTSLTLLNSRGEVIAQTDIAILEAIISQARAEDSKFDHKNPASVTLWLSRVSKAFTEYLKVPISISIASILIREVLERMSLLKKTLSFEQLSTTVGFTDSTPLPNSQSPLPAEFNCSTQTSLDNQPSPNFDKETPHRNLKPNEYTPSF